MRLKIAAFPPPNHRTARKVTDKYPSESSDSLLEAKRPAGTPPRSVSRTLSEKLDARNQEPVGPIRS